jgi:hypothetical protein
MLVESKLFLDVSKQRVDLVRMWVVYGRSDRHDEPAERHRDGAGAFDLFDRNRILSSPDNLPEAVAIDGQLQL